MYPNIIRAFENFLDELPKHWESIRKETITSLGDKDALHIIDFHVINWIEIDGWIHSKYDEEEKKNIVFLQFRRLFKEMYWLQFLFYSANYPVIYRNLRYIWELFCKAFYVDIIEYPNLSFDEQIEKMGELETEQESKGKLIPSWTIIEKALKKILNRDEQYIKSNFKPLWKHLNKYAHPSIELMDIIKPEEFQLTFQDSFNENLAKDTLKKIDEVFDIVNMVIFKKFSRIKDLGLEYGLENEWGKHLPNTMKIIKE